MPHLWTSRRIVTGEIMDAPTIDTAAHLQALIGLERINRVSHTARQILKPIGVLAQRARLKNLSLLDVACGGGDVPLQVALKARAQGLHIDLILLDRSPTALGQAVANAARAGIAYRVIQVDVLTEFTPPPVDVVMSTLFLHHLRQPAETINLLRNMRQCARHLVLISDLRRSFWGLVAAGVGCRVLSRSRMVHYDGVTSVRAAWTPEELLDLATQAGMENVRIQRCWPWRMLLVWERSEETRHETQ